MSDIDNNDTQGLPVQDELASLKQRADMMGLAYHPSIGVDKLRQKISDALNDVKTEEEPVNETRNTEAAGVEEETEGQKRVRLKKEATKLVRIRLQCMNPAKKELHGEVISVGNAVVGTYKKFIPFENNEDGYHVPHIIYEHLLGRECQVFQNVKTKNGVTLRRGKLIKEFAVEVLPPLSPEELQELARRQAMSAGQTV